MGLLQNDIRLILDDVKYVQSKYEGIGSIGEREYRLWDSLENTIENMHLTCLQGQFQLAFCDLIESEKDPETRMEYLDHFRSTLQTLLHCAEYIAPLSEEDEPDQLLIDEGPLHSLDITTEDTNIPHLQGMVFGERAATREQIEELFREDAICGALVRYKEKIIGYALFDQNNEEEVTTIADCAAQGEHAAEILLCNILQRVSCNTGAHFPRHKRLEECIEEWHESLHPQTKDSWPEPLL